MIVSEAWQYPVKSCTGIPLETVEFDTYGLGGDRQFAIVTETGRILSQKTCARLNLISVSRSPQAQLCLAASGMPDLVVQFSAPEDQATVKLYFGEATVRCAAQETSDWLGDFLGKECCLVQCDRAFHLNPHPAAEHLFLREQMRFPDCAPVLLIGTASLDDLNARLETPVSIKRFRPNIVLETESPYIEDSFKTIRIGDVVLEYMGACERCGVTQIVPGTEQREKEPFRTLGSYRRMANGLSSGVAFGVYLKPLTTGTIKLGDKVKVLRSGASAES